MFSCRASSALRRRSFSSIEWWKIGRQRGREGLHTPRRGRGKGGLLSQFEAQVVEKALNHKRQHKGWGAQRVRIELARDAAMQGIDWTAWDGKPCGYEGHLTYSWSFLQAVLLREPQFRARLYRPLGLTAATNP